ncbi:MAG: hypothetical protein ACOY93_00870 [Bacillota bacterium]
MPEPKKPSAPTPAALPELLGRLVGVRVQVATEGGHAWEGQVGAVVGNLLVLGERITFIDLGTVTAVSPVTVQPGLGGDTTPRGGRVVS